MEVVGFTSFLELSASCSQETSKPQLITMSAFLLTCSVLLGLLSTATQARTFPEIPGKEFMLIISFGGSSRGATPSWTTILPSDNSETTVKFIADPSTLNPSIQTTQLETQATSDCETGIPCRDENYGKRPSLPPPTPWPSPSDHHGKIDQPMRKGSSLSMAKKLRQALITSTATPHYLSARPPPSYELASS